MGTFYKPTPHCFQEPRAVGTTEQESWCRLALQYIRVRRSRTHGTPAFNAFTAEDIAIEMAVHQYPKPRDARWWGTVMQRAKREEMIRDTGEKRLSHAGHRTPVWSYK